MAKLKTKKSELGNSIVIKTEEVDIRILRGYYKNPRIGDVEVVAESLAKNGQYRPIIVNVGSYTGRKNEILAGNHTYMGARRLGWKKILVSWVDVDESHARRIVMVDNASADQGNYDDDILFELMKEEKEITKSLVGTGYTDDLLDKLVEKQETTIVEQEEDDYDPIISKVARAEEAPTSMDGVGDLTNQVYFNSDLEYEIPPLLPNMLFDECPKPIDIWAGHELDYPRRNDVYWLAQWHAGSRGIRWDRSICSFYAPDAHFDSFFTDPATNTKKILNLKMLGSIMPNFSMIDEAPLATWIWSIYRSYFCARYLQEAGVKIIPDIQLGTDGVCMELSTIGIPKGVGVVATQIQTVTGGHTRKNFEGRSDMDYIRGVARNLRDAEKKIRFKQIIVYGYKDADKVVERADLKADVIRVQNRTSRRREYLEGGYTINTQQVRGKKKLKRLRTNEEGIDNM